MLTDFRIIYKLFALLLTLSAFNVPASSFVAFESGQVRPLALSSDKRFVYAVNTPDNQLEIFHVTPTGLTPMISVPVGLEPVALALRNDDEIWVVNHLSDSISIVDLTATKPRVTRTLLVGDEPRDIVFAGPGGDRAFITTARRGQNLPAGHDPLLTTPGIGRADVWVFDAANPGTTLEGTPLTILSLFTDTPRALAVSADGSTVYAAGFHTGNQTTAIHENNICDDADKSDNTTQGPCSVPGGSAPGGLPIPNRNIELKAQPEASLIVKFNPASNHWEDELGRDWSSLVKFDLPDSDIFSIDANANPPAMIDAITGVGTVLFNMVVNPVSGKVYVSNTEARNEVRFEGTRSSGVPEFDTATTVNGHLHETRITVIDGTTVIPRHLNKHIDYAIVPSPPGTREKSLATPTEMVISSDGTTLYLAAFGSSKIGVFDTSDLEDDSFAPDSADHIAVSGGGPSGLVLDETSNRLYAFTRFDNAISIIDTGSQTETFHISLHNPEPASIVDGRPFLYDANLTSSNGEASCASCHIFGDLDSLAWDLGDPTGAEITNPPPFTFAGSGGDFHPMKGPMTTQSLRGMANHGPLHWRGDRTGASSGIQPDTGKFDEDEGFQKFNVAFAGLLGRTGPLTTTEIQQFSDFMLQVTMPPNPVRGLDNQLTSTQVNANNFFFTVNSDTQTCNTCHVLDETANTDASVTGFQPSKGFFGSDGKTSNEAEDQPFKVAHLRNLYQKVGMFGMADTDFFNAGDNNHKGDQIRGFGFLHDGSVDTVFRFLQANLFNEFPGAKEGFSSDTQRRDMENLMLAFNSNLKPIVGQQVTLTSTNSSVTNPRIDLMLSQAALGHAGVVVKGIVSGQEFNAARLADGSFMTDVAAAALLSDAAIRALATTPGQEITYTAVPPGSDIRIGIDRDEDGILNGDDNCPATDNAAQFDGDTDGLGDACEGNFDADLNLADTDLDGIDDGDEVNLYSTNPGQADTDGDGSPDGDEISAGTDPRDPASFPVVADGDINLDTFVDTADVLLALRVVLGLDTLTDEQTRHGDVAPLSAGTPAPNGVIDIADVLVIQRKVMGLVSF